MAGFAGGLVVEELLISAAHTSPAALAPVLPYITVQYSTIQYSTVQYITVQYSSTVQYSNGALKGQEDSSSFFLCLLQKQMVLL